MKETRAEKQKGRHAEMRNGGTETMRVRRGEKMENKAKELEK